MRPEKFIENFSNHLKNVIARSISLAASLNHNEVNPLHILFVMAEEPGSIAAEILSRMKIEPKNILEYIRLLNQLINHFLPDDMVKIEMTVIYINVYGKEMDRRHFHIVV